MTRLIDWEARLQAYLEPLAGRPFRWGRHDCALFAAGAVQAMTGLDLAAPYRGHYRTARGSVRALRRFGAGTLEATIDALFPACAPGFARRGDLAMVDGMVGVCVGAEALFVGEEAGAPGLVRYSRPAWAKCWSVG